MIDLPTLYELRQRMNRLRKPVQKIFQTEFLKRVSAEATTAIDRLALGEKVFARHGISQTILSDAMWEAEERNRKIKKTGLRDPEYDFSCELEIIPIPDKILVQVFCENIAVNNLIARQKYLLPYSYWNNTDPDESCTTKEWNQRERDWNKALPGIGIPSQNGFMAQLNYPSPFLGFPSITDVLMHIPTIDRRVEHMANTLAWNTMTNRMLRKEKPKTHEEKMRLCMNALWAVRDTPEGQKLLKEKKIFVANKISLNITKEHLEQQLDPLPKKQSINT
jgi:hypothetical protein